MKFYGLLDYVEKIRVQILDSLRKAQMADYDRRVNFRQKLDELTTHCNRYLQSHKLGNSDRLEERDKINECLNIHVSIIKNNQKAYKSLANDFAKPLVIHHVMTDIKSQSPAFIEIANLASLIIKLPSEIEAGNKILADAFKSYADAISPVLCSLQSEFKELDEYCNQVFPNQS